MENIMLVPSVISQSYFLKYTDEVDGVDGVDGVVDLKGTEIDYFYSLLYIYREKLLDQTPGLLIKEEDGKYRYDESVECEPVKIALKEFSEMWVDEDRKDCGVKDRKKCGIKYKNDCGDKDRKNCSVKYGKKCGVVTVGQYENIRPFIKELKMMSIVVNVLCKNKEMPYTEFKMVYSLSWDNTLKTEPYLTISFAKEFRKIIIHPKELFKKVDLKTLFLLRGKNQKLLYLIFKDYSKDEDNKKIHNGKKGISSEEFEKLFGVVPQNIKGISDKITSKTELTVSCDETGIGRIKTYKFTIENNEKTKKTVKKGSKPKKQKKEINPEMWEKAVKSTKNWIKKGGKVDDEDAYTWGIHNKLIAELKPHEPSESEISIDKWIEDKQFELGYDDANVGTPVIVIDVGSSDPICIDDKYKLVGNPHNEPISKTPEKTWEKINEIIKNGGVPMVEYYPKCPQHLTNSCFFSKETLMKKGHI